MCLAHELTEQFASGGEGGGGAQEERVSVPYGITIARLHMYQQHYPEAKRYLTRAVSKDIKVQST